MKTFARQIYRSSGPLIMSHEAKCLVEYPCSRYWTEDVVAVPFLARRRRLDPERIEQSLIDDHMRRRTDAT